jgi:hypothetical protein
VRCQVVCRDVDERAEGDVLMQTIITKSRKHIYEVSADGVNIVNERLVLDGGDGTNISDVNIDGGDGIQEQTGIIDGGN